MVYINILTHLLWTFAPPWLVVQCYIYKCVTNLTVRLVVFACIFTFNIVVTIVYLWKYVFRGK